MATSEDHSHQTRHRNLLCYDILEQILPNLPVKSLFRFKSVSKQLLHSISNAVFSKKFDANSHVTRFHLSGYPRAVLVEPLLPLKPLWFRDHDLDEFPWSVTINSSTRVEIVELYNPFSAPLQTIEVLGSCNGLLFLHIRNETYLWNPSIREHVRLSPHNYLWDEHNRDRHYSWVIAGLVYNSSRDEYKAVLFFEESSQMFMFSSSIGYWTEVDIPFNYTIYGDFGSETTINGCPHWLVPHRNVSEHTTMSLIFFDTVDDKFKTVSIPLGWHVEYTDNDCYEFGQLRGCLFAAKKKYMGARKTDIWVMMEHGVRESWTKLFSIPHTPMIYKIRPLGFTYNADEVVLEVVKNRIVVYNLKTNEHTFIVGTTNDNSYDHGGFKSYEYVESLVSPCHFVRTDIESEVESDVESEKGGDQRRRRSRRRRKRRNGRRKRRFF